MRRLLFLCVLLCACPKKREQAGPAPEAKPVTTAANLEHDLAALTCEDGVLGRIAAPSTSAAAAAPSVSTEAVAIASASTAPSVSPSALPSGLGDLLAPIELSDGGLGGLGTFGPIGFGTGGGYGIGGGRHLERSVVRIVGAPVDDKGARAFAASKGACEATAAIRACHADAGKPTGTIELALKVDAGKAAVERVGGTLDDAKLLGCVQSAFSATTFDATAAGTTKYRLTFEKIIIKPPKLADGKPEASGGLPPEVIHRIVRRNLPRIRACYEMRLKAVPTLSGKVVVSFEIDEKGATRSVRADEGTITDEPMRTCIAKAFGTLAFPTPTAVTRVKYPLVFQQG